MLQMTSKQSKQSNDQSQKRTHEIGFLMISEGVEVCKFA